ncbi:MAG: gliding motility-associated C-terminal domain-containing protein [Crocinitomicaceae bacterium]
MLVKKFILSIFCLTTVYLHGQDVGVTTRIAPMSGCEVGTATMNVKAVVYNFTNSIVPANSVTVKYSVDGGPPISQILSTNLGGYASYNFTFTTFENFVAARSWNIKVWTVLGTDVNHLNDTLAFVFTNDSTIVPGTLTSNTNICIDGNSGTLNLTGNKYDYSHQWYSSTDDVTYTGTGNTTSNYPYLNVTQTTYYQDTLFGNYCPDAYTNKVILTVDPSVVVGTTSVDTAVCETSIAGSVSVTGYTQNVSDWEQSDDNGVTWYSIADNSPAHDFSSLTTSAWFRPILESGTCGTAHGDSVHVQVDVISLPGTLLSDFSECDYETNGDTLHLVGGYGTILGWESSTDNGSTWTPIINNTINYVVPNLTGNTLYHVLLKSGTCPMVTSPNVKGTLLPNPPISLSGNQTINPGDTITIIGFGGIAGVWTPGGTLSDSTITNPLAFPDSTITYTYSIIDANGCINQGQIKIQVGPPPVIDTTTVPPITFKIYNIITVNGDGMNDVFKIDGLSLITNYTIKIFNGLGQIVFETNEYHNDWAGTYKGKTLPDGTYYYMVDSPEMGMQKGNLTILGNKN